MLLKTVSRWSVTGQMPLRLILVVPFVMQIFVAVGLTGYLGIRNSQKSINTVVSQLRSETSDRINQQILFYLEKPYLINQTIAAGISEGQIDIKDVKALEHLSWRLVNQNTVSFLQTGTPQGTSVLVERLEEGFIVARTGDADRPNRQSYRLDERGNRAELLETKLFDPRTRPWYKAAVEAGEPSWSNIFLGASGKATLSLSQPIYGETGNLLGVQHSNFRPSRIHEFLKSVKVGLTGQTFIVDRSGNIIASSLIEQPYKIQDEDLEQIPATDIENPVIRATAKAVLERFGSFSIDQSQQLDVVVDGDLQFVQISPIRDEQGIDWFSIVVVPESDFTAEIDANTRTTMLLCLAALVVATVLGIYTAQWIAQPLRRLSQSSEAMADGALDQNVELSNVRELNVLARSFNRMTQQLRGSFTQLEQTNEQLEHRVEERTADLKDTLQELQRTQAQMIQAEKMSSLGQLVAGVAHEINNPVNFIHGNVTHINEYTQNLLELLQLYQTEFPDSTPAIRDKMDEIDLEFLNEDVLKLLTSMQVGTERIRGIVTSLRNFSRLDEAQVKEVDVHEGIESTLLILQHRLKAKVNCPPTTLIRAYGDLPLVECHPGQMNQVFMNILVNALDALEESNTNRTYQAIEANPNQITIRTAVIDAEWVEVAIADNGPGMLEETRQHIFDPFFTTKPVGKGTGMGMSISYQIITEKHGGNLSCCSTVGKGTEFVIQIPVRLSCSNEKILVGTAENS
ncbi:HAMP domain-containing protein (plasmid) [Phormidium sp. CLA17]|uniref:ATP-binding protein n=1 Tax=Leptolyngbya sp. Cla-17 TaxID=2803751 RepID=UPI00149259BA|nr:ATP-binding protein [Leptolyngbya sp. Cla-17]MBM0744788.1 HAMP domain-containing protein [Leptolyngbya sp. Cla-17]